MCEPDCDSAAIPTCGAGAADACRPNRRLSIVTSKATLSSAPEYRDVRERGEQGGSLAQASSRRSNPVSPDLASVPHMMQLSAKSASHHGVHQRKFAAWL